MELRAEHLQKMYGRRTVVQGVSLKVRQGEIVGLLGPNGAGKTTLTKLLLRFYEPTSGEILLDGININRFNKAEYQEFFGVIFLGATGFSITFTFVSAIASKADSSSTLMAILGFPLIIPVLLTLIKLSANALRLMRDTGIEKDVMILVSIDLLLLGIALVLFPFLWRD